MSPFDFGDVEGNGPGDVVVVPSPCAPASAEGDGAVVGDGLGLTCPGGVAGGPWPGSVVGRSEGLPLGVGDGVGDADGVGETGPSV